MADDSRVMTYAMESNTLKEMQAIVKMVEDFPEWYVMEETYILGQVLKNAGGSLCPWKTRETLEKIRKEKGISKK